MTSNADKFAALFGTPAQNEPPPTPRRPAPVPEAGHAPKEKPPSPFEQFEQAMKSHFNLP